MSKHKNSVSDKTPSVIHSNDTPVKELEAERVPLQNHKSRYIVNNKLPGWHYCLVNDSHEGANIQMYKDAGYVLDKSDQTGTIQEGQTVHPKHSFSSTKSFPTKQGNMRMYLMRIPEKLYQQDLLAQTKRDDEIMETIYGENELSYLQNQTKLEIDTRNNTHGKY